MKRGMVIIIVGILLLVLAGVVWAAFNMGIIGGGGDGEPAENLPIEVPGAGQAQQEPTAAPPKSMQKIVIAVQNIGRGMEITEDSVALWDWPSESVPPDAIVGSESEDLNGNGKPDAIDQVLGMRMRTSAVRFEPILQTMVIDRIDLTGTGSDAALAIPEGRVLIGYPLPSIDDDPTTAVAYALRAGDHVDMMISLALVDLDEEFHTKLANDAQIIQFETSEEGEESISLVDFTYGRIEEGPLGLIFNIIPGEEEQRPRLTSQLTVQDAIVVRVGRYPTLEEEVRGIDPQAPPTPTPVPEGQEEQVGVPAEPPAPPQPTVMVLAVTPQEALVIKFAWEINADIDFALRGVGDQALYQTNAVTLQYLMETYNIAVPPKLQYGVEPPVYRLDSFIDKTKPTPTPQG
jgi:Flp pilus assembly protein CpaB